MSEQKVPTPVALLNPEAQGSINAMVSAAVREAVASVFQGLTPVLKEMALTPEKIREANKPYEDPLKIARELRETQNSKAQEEEIRRLTAERQRNCMHMDKNGKTALCLIHNFPDRQPRGICPLCHDIVHPKMWVIDAPDSKTGKSNARIVEAHRDYRQVLLLESMS
jgi:hypothetical protein